VSLNLKILVGTMTGTAEMVAQEVKSALEAAGHSADIRMMDGLDASVFAYGETFLICTSTYGQGDVPDNAQEFLESLERARPDLSSVIYGVFALGDTTYRDTYCAGGLRFDALLTELGAKRFGDVLKHDASSGTLPEEVAAQWIVSWVAAVEKALSAPAVREVVIDGKRLESLSITGSSDAPTIVLLHEGLGSVALWKDFPHALAERTGCSVFVYSRYGHGNSEKQAEPREVSFMHREGEVALPELLDTMGIERPILLGHSDGGSIALIFAGKYPERVNGLILEAPHVFVEEYGLKSIRAAKVAFEATDFRTKLGRYHANVDETFRAWNDIWLDPKFSEWNIESYLETIRCPVLCLQGEQDEYGTRAQVDTIVEKIPGAELVMLSNCGHSPHRDQHDATLRAITAFVSKLKANESEGGLHGRMGQYI
jgi:pimeloyl-ACP methyl ester carboxylesterase/flavodoxin